MLDVIRKVREVAAAFQAGDYAKAARLAAELILTLTGPRVVGSAGTAEANDLEAAVVELEACCTATRSAAAAADPKAIDPGTVVAIITAVLQLLDWWRNRR